MERLLVELSLIKTGDDATTLKCTSPINVSFCKMMQAGSRRSSGQGYCGSWNGLH